MPLGQRGRRARRRAAPRPRAGPGRGPRRPAPPASRRRPAACRSSTTRPVSPWYSGAGCGGQRDRVAGRRATSRRRPRRAPATARRRLAGAAPTRRTAPATTRAGRSAAAVRAHLGQGPEGGGAEVDRRLAADARPRPSWPPGTPRWCGPGRAPGCGSAPGRTAARAVPAGMAVAAAAPASRAAEQRRGERLHALDRDALGQLVQHLGQLRVLAATARRPGPAPPAVSSSSRHGGAHSRSTCSMVRWSATAKVRISSTSSPQNSTRNGCSSVGGKTSRMPPRTANSPRLVTRSTRAYAMSASRRTTVVQVGARRRRRSSTGSRSPRPLSCGCSTDRTGATTTRERPRARLGVGQPAQHGQPPADGVASGATAARAAASPRTGRPPPARPGAGRPAPRPGPRPPGWWR